MEGGTPTALQNFKNRTGRDLHPPQIDPVRVVAMCCTGSVKTADRTPGNMCYGRVVRRRGGTFTLENMLWE